MRLLHTSDWHLGRSLHRADLLGAQALFVDHLVEVVRSERIDVVLVSGDVYDRALPPVDAVSLYDEALFRLTSAGAKVVLISGNHDSAPRLGVNSRVLEGGGVYLRTRPEAAGEPVLLADEHGPVALYPIPYLEPAAVASGAGVDRTHLAVLGAAAGAARADLATRPGMRSVALAHGWVHGGAASDSERDVSVGGVSAVPVSLFDGFDYVALGHLHGPQTLAPHLRYSGSPLPYSFSEAGHAKASWLVELDASGLARVESVPAPVFRRLSTLRGTLAELLSAPAHAGQENDFVAATLTDVVRPEAPMDALRRRFPHALTMAFEPEGVAAEERSYAERVRGRGDVDLALDFVSLVRGAAAGAAEAALLGEAFEAVRVAEDRDPYAAKAEPAEASA
ncbi:MAG: exonuclease SbcCD subunit D [Sporichthyaceae bacterium]